MTISVDVKLPKDMSIQVTMPVEDAVALIGGVDALIKGDMTGAEAVTKFKDLLTANLPNL